MRAVGTRGEDRAVSYLQEKGYVIVERNVYSRFGELDIVAKDGKTLVFVEVKFRSSLRGGNPTEAITYHKMRAMLQTARWYLYSRGYGEYTSCRFDLIGILGDKITHLQNIIET